MCCGDKAFLLNKTIETLKAHLRDIYVLSSIISRGIRLEFNDLVANLNF